MGNKRTRREGALSCLSDPTYTLFSFVRTSYGAKEEGKDGKRCVTKHSTYDASLRHMGNIVELVYGDYIQPMASPIDFLLHEKVGTLYDAYIQR